jgi:hypothetical protein
MSMTSILSLIVVAILWVVVYVVIKNKNWKRVIMPVATFTGLL